MLSIKLKALNRPCTTTTGGVARIWLFDRDDFDFTQAAADANEDMPAYTAIALRAGATAVGGAKMFPYTFEDKEAEYKYTQSRKGSSIKYEHTVEAITPHLSQLLTQVNQKIDKASACNGIGVIVELQSGVILVMGEKYVNGELMSGNFKMKQDGSSGTSGKLNDDMNGQTTVLKGDFGRPLYEFTGGVGAIDALAA